MKKFLKEWEWFSTKDYRHLPVFIGFVILLIGLTAALTLAYNSTQGGQSGASRYNCIPLPRCYNNHTCPEIISYRIPNFRWCLPTSTPTCINRPACLDSIPRCAMPEPINGWCVTSSPTATPIPFVTPTPPSGCSYVPVACPLLCVKGQPCPTCTPKLVCPSPTPKPTCRPRPACLDATPRCMIPETSDMCPKTPIPTPN